MDKYFNHYIAYLPEIVVVTIRIFNRMKNINHRMNDISLYNVLGNLLIF